MPGPKNIGLINATIRNYSWPSRVTGPIFHLKHWAKACLKNQFIRVMRVTLKPPKLPLAAACLA